jgi:hypothetical protein
MQPRRLRVASLVVAALLGAPLAAAPRAVLDYRNETPDTVPVISAETRAALAKATQAAGQRADFVLLGHVRGDFSAAGSAEDLYLIADKAPAAADRSPQGAGQILVAVRGGAASATYRLPAEQRYRRIAGAVDSDGDGRGEVLLETGFYNMGQSVTSLDLVGLGADGMAAIRQSLKEVVYDGCDNPSERRKDGPAP